MTTARASVIPGLCLIAMMFGPSWARGQEDLEVGAGTFQASEPPPILGPQAAPLPPDSPVWSMNLEAIRTSKKENREERAVGPELAPPPVIEPANAEAQEPTELTRVEGEGPTLLELAPRDPQAPPAEAIRFTPRPTGLSNPRALSFNEGGFATSFFAEPSLAVRGNEILLTYNILASMSNDGGGTFFPINPSQVFGQGTMKYFGDELAIYDKKTDCMLWLMQQHDSTRAQQTPGSNFSDLLRLAVAPGSDAVNQVWDHWYEFTPATFEGFGADAWFDYPDMAVSDTFLYIAVNVYKKSTNGGLGSLVVRIKLADLAAKKRDPAFQFFRSDLQSLRPVQGATGTMYLGTHLGQQGIRVYIWGDDGPATPTVQDVAVNAWNGGAGAFTDTWLARCDSRITAAWYNRSRKQVGFGWTAASSASPALRVAHCRFALFQEPAPGRLERDVEAQLWNPNFAYGYPAAAANANGDAVGLSVLYGGGNSFRDPSFAVGAIRQPTDAAGGRAVRFLMKKVASGTGTYNRSGDYLTVRPHPVDTSSWVAAGYVPLAVAPGQQEPRGTVHYVQFDVSRAGTSGPLVLGPEGILEGMPAAGPATRADMSILNQKLDETNRLLQEIRDRLGP